MSMSMSVALMVVGLMMLAALVAMAIAMVVIFERRSLSWSLVIL